MQVQIMMIPFRLLPPAKKWSQLLRHILHSHDKNEIPHVSSDEVDPLLEFILLLRGEPGELLSRHLQHPEELVVGKVALIITT